MKKNEQEELKDWKETVGVLLQMLRQQKKENRKLQKEIQTVEKTEP